ncbi:MAG: dTDP-4-dehydrorhamnose 3,5-epimerase [bacterium]|nr:dTDP-4-dehydrorhamnose 3,5-epimerase [bacterium]MDZ4296155.1 dTDP-4-dehydrorhamnose 3,5-epimerase [Patescibacteria group bacterium]
MHIEPGPLKGLLVITPVVHADDRGFFMEVFRKDLMASAGVDLVTPQENHSRSRRGVVRGLHFQWNPAMGKLMRVTRGEAFVVALDIRKKSPAFGKWFGLELGEENKIMLWAPPGFATGFCALAAVTDVQYKCTAVYNPHCESGIRFNDPALAIPWPVAEPILSDKDRNAQTLQEWCGREESEVF